MKLSIVIVNYNVKHLLEQCLHSVLKAASGINSEVIVVDNNSTDGSRDYLLPLFAGIKFIFNTENYGFGKACNQGYKISSGEYVLFLNPDTVVSGSCFKKCISFFESRSDTGAIGVRMTDEKGTYLKESKRGFPSPAASFYKLFGLAALFPTSKIFAGYYMGHLRENKNDEVEVLSGAFMMIRHTVLEKTGGFDESFFMYGEDIDLSYRIHQAGYKNFYLGEITITHFKGKSTPKNYQYISNFYRAMSHFVKKHYTGKKSSSFIALLLAGIQVRKLIARAGFLFN